MFRTMRTAPELIAMGQDLERRSPGAVILNYVNPMAMLTRIMNLACPKVTTLGLCHNIQWATWDICQWLKISRRDLRYVAAGVNHMDWFLRLEYLDGRSVFPGIFLLTHAVLNVSFASTASVMEEKVSLVHVAKRARVSTATVSWAPNGSSLVPAAVQK